MQALLQNKNSLCTITNRFRSDKFDRNRDHKKMCTSTRSPYFLKSSEQKSIEDIAKEFFECVCPFCGVGA